MDKIDIAIIMPVHNGSTTLNQVFDSLEKQDFRFKKLIIIYFTMSMENENLENNPKFAYDIFSR